MVSFLRSTLLAILVKTVISWPIQPPPCHDFFFTVHTTDGLNDTGVIQSAATYQISAAYCPSTKTYSHRQNTVQVLLHGAVSNKYYWSALGPVGSPLQYQPYNYSYVEFALNEGYHTIAIDRLGYGNSTHPDPSVVRTEVEAEITKILTEQIRKKHVPSLPRFDNIILIGHSFGSFVINAALNKYPAVADAAIMTGYVHAFDDAANSLNVQIFAPAKTIFPARFGNLDPGYLTEATEASYRAAFLSANGTFDPLMPNILFNYQDVQASGEQASIVSELSGGFGDVKATKYKGCVAFVAGQNDGAFCNDDCGSGDQSLAALSAPYFPAARNFSGFLIPNTGHLLQYHLSSREGFAAIHTWLEDNGF